MIKTTKNKSILLLILLTTILILIIIINQVYRSYNSNKIREVIQNKFVNQLTIYRDFRLFEIAEYAESEVFLNKFSFSEPEYTLLYKYNNLQGDSDRDIEIIIVFTLERKSLTQFKVKEWQEYIPVFTDDTTDPKNDYNTLKKILSKNDIRAKDEESAKHIDGIKFSPRKPMFTQDEITEKLRIEAVNAKDPYETRSYERALEICTEDYNSATKKIEAYERGETEVDGQTIPATEEWYIGIKKYRDTANCNDPLNSGYFNETVKQQIRDGEIVVGG